MERGAGSKQSLLVHELMRGQELLRQLMSNLDQPNRTGSCKPLASEILLSIDMALCIAKANGLDSPRLAPYSYGGTDSTVSPRSENYRERREMSKKRKTLPKWTSQVMTGTEGLEGPVDDGYSWRKYGQKHILGAKHPRGYYRCRHRGTSGCLATKQVQRSDQNPSILDVSYRGSHTCQLVSPRSERKQKQSQELQPHRPDLLLSFQNDLRVRTNVSFMYPDDLVFSSPSAVGNCFSSNIFPASVSSATSESNFCGGEPNPQTSESHYKETVTAASSATDSPLVDMDFLLNDIEFDADFSFDTATFFT